MSPMPLAAPPVGGDSRYHNEHDRDDQQRRADPSEELTERHHGRATSRPDGGRPGFGRTLRMSLLGVISQGRISTYPSVPCTRMRCPSGISRVASTTPTTAGKPYSRAITAPWVIRPPTSVTRPVIATNSGVQLGSV